MHALHAGPSWFPTHQTLEKIASSNRITVGYRESSVPFSWLTDSPKAVGFAVDLTEAIIDTNERVLRKEITDRGLDTQVLASKDYADGLADPQADRAAALALDDVLPFVLRANADQPAVLEVVGVALQVEPYGCRLRKNDPAFKALVDRTTGGR
jgi:ABC-type amino acid transport substrate-binding protein